MPSPETHFVDTQPYTNMCTTFLIWGQPSKIIISGRTPSTYKQLPVDFAEHQRLLLRLWRRGSLDGDFLIASRTKIQSLSADREGNNTDGLPVPHPPGNAWRRRARGLGFVEEYERRFNQKLKDLECWMRTGKVDPNYRTRRAQRDAWRVERGRLITARAATACVRRRSALCGTTEAQQRWHEVSTAPPSSHYCAGCARESHLLPTDKWKKKEAIDHLLFWQPEQVEEMVNLLAAKRYQQVRAEAAKLAADTQDKNGPMAEVLPADFATQLYPEVPRHVWVLEYVNNATRHFAPFMPIFSTRMKQLAHQDGMLL